jgi:hypothetical protein
VELGRSFFCPSQRGQPIDSSSRDMDVHIHNSGMDSSNMMNDLEAGHNRKTSDPIEPDHPPVRSS